MSLRPTIIAISSLLLDRCFEYGATGVYTQGEMEDKVSSF
jgi:hypothetical protein